MLIGCWKYSSTIMSEVVLIHVYHIYLIYSRLSLSRLPLSRMTAYPEVKIWSLFQHGNIKILWKRGEIALLPRSNFSSFPQYFQYISNLRIKLHIHLWNVFVWFIFSSILQIWYVEVWISQSVSESPLEFEITRVDCIWIDRSEQFIMI